MEGECDKGVGREGDRLEIDIEIDLDRSSDIERLLSASLTERLLPGILQ